MTGTDVTFESKRHHWQLHIRGERPHALDDHELYKALDAKFKVLVREIVKRPIDNYKDPDDAAWSVVWYNERVLKSCVRRFCRLGSSMFIMHAVPASARQEKTPRLLARAQSRRR
jgi:hypothetical protein